jgi:hypothetical protein
MRAIAGLGVLLLSIQMGSYTWKVRLYPFRNACFCELIIYLPHYLVVFHPKRV